MQHITCLTGDFLFFFSFFLRACVRACNTGQALWKRQQRSSAFKWIKTPAQSPGPAGIGQTGCSLDEDLRLIISHAAFVFAATVAYLGNTVRYTEACVYEHGDRYLASQPAKLRSLLPFYAFFFFLYHLCSILFAEF